MARKPTTTKDNGSTALAIPTAATRELTPGIWKMISEMAPVMYKARLFGVTSPEQAAAIMLKGFELGLSTTASFELIHVIDGKPGLSPRGALALLHNSPLIKEIKITRLEEKGKFIGYECFMSRSDNGFSHTSRFTMEMATKAGLVKANSGWMKYEENMCMYRAVGFTADVVGPDITAGMTSIMKMPEAYGLVITDSGDVIDATAVNVPSVDPLQELISEYTLDRVAQVAMETINKYPETKEDIDAVRVKLENGQK